MNTNINNTRLHSRRGVAPVIATLLLVAIAVVGGAIVFAYSQNFFSSSQISSRPNIEAIKILGYDARDVANLDDHNGVNMTSTAGTADATKKADERIAVYVKNDSVQAVTLNEIRFGGTVYTYDGSGLVNVGAGEYAVMLSGNPENVLNAPVGEIQPGQTVTILIDLGENQRMGRDVQFKLTTNNGAVFVGTVVIGQQSG